MEIEWKDGFEISVRVENGSPVISANREGLLSLSKQLAALAEAAPGSHIHYDAYNSLESGSAELIIERIRQDRSGTGGSGEGGIFSIQATGRSGAPGSRTTLRARKKCGSSIP